jgi:hypothetical protein
MLPSLLLLAALAQPNPAEQIRYLMYESPRPEKHGSEGGTFSVFSCGPANGEAADNRALAKALATTAAIPAMEAKLADIEAAGSHDFSALNANWLLLAYARAKGPTAYGRLRHLYKLPEYANDTDRAIALARGLTAYISTHNRSPVHPGSFSCEQGTNLSPRDALNVLIRQTLANTPKSIGIGYRFHDQGRWSEPIETLDQDRPPHPAFGHPVGIETTLHTHTGATCEFIKIHFQPAKRTDFAGTTYTVQAPNLAQRITACAATPDFPWSRATGIPLDPRIPRPASTPTAPPPHLSQTTTSAPARQTPPRNPPP